MPITTLSPTACATRVIDELLAVASGSRPDRQRQMVLLIRQLIRDQYEHCAQIAEHWVPENDLYEERSGLEVCDAIAEEIRKLADERVDMRTVAELADAPVLGTGGETREGSIPFGPTR